MPKCDEQYNIQLYRKHHRELLSDRTHSQCNFVLPPSTSHDPKTLTRKREQPNWTPAVVVTVKIKQQCPKKNLIDALPAMQELQKLVWGTIHKTWDQNGIKSVSLIRVYSPVMKVSSISLGSSITFSKIEYLL